MQQTFSQANLQTLQQHQVVIETLIGIGSQGHVYRGKQNKTRVAVKVIPFESSNDASGVQPRNEFVEQEIQKMIKLKDKPFLVKLLDAFCDQQYYYLVMEWCGTDTSTTLQTIITARNRKMRYARDILDGLRIIHQHFIVHNDVKPANILIQKNGDFGISESIFKMTLAEQTDTSTTTTTTTSSDAPLGTKPYWSPEMFNNTSNYDKQLADVFACGVMFLELFQCTTCPQAGHELGVQLLQTSNEHEWNDVILSKLTSEIKNQSKLTALLLKMLAPSRVRISSANAFETMKQVMDEYSNAWSFGDVIQDPLVQVGTATAIGLVLAYAVIKLWK